MLCKETAVFLDANEVCSLAGCTSRRPAACTSQSVESDVNGFNCALWTGRPRFGRKLLEVTEARRLAGGQGSLIACNRKEFVLLDESSDKIRLQTSSMGNRWVAQLASVRCDSTASTEMEDERGFHSISNEINDLERDKLRALIDNEEVLEAGTGTTEVDLTTKRSAQLSIPFVTVIEEDLRLSPPIALHDANHLNFSESVEREASTRSSTGLRGRRGYKFLMENRSRFEEFLPGLLSALERADTSEKINRILSPALELSSSDLSLILSAVKSPERVTELFFWMKEKGKTIANFDVYRKVFKVLSKRQEWILIDNLLREAVLSFQDEAGCEAFNALFQACLIADSSDWATKWFQLMIEQGIHPNGTTYTLLLSLYQRLRKLQEAEFVYQYMDKSGGKFPKVYSAMINLYTRACQFGKVEQILNKMREEGVKPEKEHWLLRVGAYVRQGKVKEAEEVVQQMQESGIRPNVVAYNSMITVNGKANRFKEARDWFFQLEQEGLQPDAATYRSLIGACGRSGRLKEALNFYDRMRLSGFLPNIHNFNSLIHLHRKVGNSEKILCLLSDMREMGCCPDSSTLDAVVKVYERYGELEKIPPALKLLQEAGWLPDEKSYGILLRAYIRCSLVEQALDAFSHLCTRAKLGESLCHNLIYLCKTAGQYEEAIHVFQKMQRAGNQPSLITSCTIIDIYTLKGAIEEGEALFGELRSSGQELDSVAYNAIINMYLKVDLVQKAAEILNLMNEHKGLQPDSSLFLSMLRVCAKCGMHQECVNVYWRMIKSKLIWTESLYNGVVHYCGRALPLEEITKVFQAATYANISIDNVTCNVMIEIFGKTGLLEKAENVFIMAQRQGVLDCVSFNTLLDAYGKFKEFGKMEAVLTVMDSEGFKGCVEAYNSILNAYGKSGQIGKMNNIRERMRRAGCDPEISTFSTLINVYGKEGLIIDLEAALKEMEAAGIKPDKYMYDTLICAYGKAEMLDEAVRLFNEMQNAGCVPDGILYTCMISAFEKSKNPSEAAKWSLQMQEAGMSH